MVVSQAVTEFLITKLPQSIAISSLHFYYCFIFKVKEQRLGNEMLRNQSQVRNRVCYGKRKMPLTLKLDFPDISSNSLLDTKKSGYSFSLQILPSLYHTSPKQLKFISPNIVTLTL